MRDQLYLLKVINLTNNCAKMTTLKNSVRLIGFLETEPEFEDASKRIRFSLATSDSFYNDNGKKIEAYQWHNIVATGEMAENLSKQLAKGMELTLEGRLTYHRFIDDMGNKRFITEIVANEVLVLENKV